MNVVTATGTKIKAHIMKRMEITKNENSVVYEIPCVDSITNTIVSLAGGLGYKTERAQSRYQTPQSEQCISEPCRRQ